MGRFYVPVCSALLVVVIGNWLALSSNFDALTAAQNQRIRFQSGGESASVSHTSLTPGESRLAEAVLDKQGSPDKPRARVLFMGNSQSLAIMDANPGDMVSAQWLQVLLARQSNGPPMIDVRLGALPNLTMTELLLRVMVAAEESPRQVDILIAPIVLEEFRGVGVRHEVSLPTRSPQAKARLVSLVRGNEDLPGAVKAVSPLIAPQSESTGVSREGAGEEPLPARLERRVQSVAEGIPLFARREELLGWLSLGLHGWRNRVLGVTSSSPRPIPDALYQASTELVELTLRYARSRGIQVVLYLAPIRPIQPNPNLPADVARIRRDLPALGDRYDMVVLDYVDLIPETLWTNYPDNAPGTEGQRDFAHFTGAAHRLLAERLNADIGSQLIRWAQDKVSPQA